MKLNVTDILKTANRSLSMTKLKIAKHSPEILLVAGVVGTVASAVLACHETTKISKILDDAGATVDTIHDCIEHPERAENYTAEDGQKDLLITYTQTGVKLVKLYAPSVILGGLSIAAILASNNILRKRNVALAAAFASVSESFDAYRGRVIEKYGKDVDTQLRMGVSEQVVQRTVTDDMGNEKQVDEIVKVCNPMGSPYVKVPENHIVIDFDLKGGDGEKSFERNLEAAAQWPKTYAELSKSGRGIHLHYIYSGDPVQLSRIYDDDIEVKVFTGKSSLRRQLTKC